MGQSDHPSPEEVELRFTELLDNADLRRPDEMRYDPEAGEIVCTWHEEKLVVAIDITDPLPTQPPV